MLTFWRHGYETTSVADLTKAMGITPPSLYTAFGDKRQLFLESVELYMGDAAEQERAINDAPSAFAAASHLLQTVAISYTGKDTPPGCLLASATAPESAESFEVRNKVADIRLDPATQFAARIKQDILVGLLPHDCDAEGMANLVVAVIQGMSVLARDGGSRLQLLAVARAAMMAWPGNN